jgi:hypothetical protein
MESDGVGQGSFFISTSQPTLKSFRRETIDVSMMLRVSLGCIRSMVDCVQDTPATNDQYLPPLGHRQPASLSSRVSSKPCAQRRMRGEHFHRPVVSPFCEKTDSSNACRTRAMLLSQLFSSSTLRALSLGYEVNPVCMGRPRVYCM